MKSYTRIIFFKAALLMGGLLLFASPARAMPVGTLLYRSTDDKQMYGYNTNQLLNNGRVNCGHVGIYVGDSKGKEMVLEAVNNGVQLTELKYFLNLTKGEEFIGAKLPLAYSNMDRGKIKMISNFLAGENLGYDRDFAQQKGPGDGQFTCVGLAEKVYESLNFGDKMTSLDQLEYTPSRYYIDITPRGYDNKSIYNQEYGDVFSTSSEFSKISRRKILSKDIIQGLVGNELGRIRNRENYFFFPYTQFLQPSLKDVKVNSDILSSRFDNSKIRGNPIFLEVVFIGTSKNLIMSPVRTAQRAADNVKKAALFIKDKAARAGRKIARTASDLKRNVQNRLNKNKPKIKDGDDKSSGDGQEGRVLSSRGSEQPSKDKNKKADIETHNRPEKKAKAKKISSKKPKTENKNKPIVLKNDDNNKDLNRSQVGVKRVIDGDTIELEDGRKIRYIGIDAPELGGPGPDDDDCLAWESRVRNIELLRAGPVVLEKDPNMDKDKYGRSLRYVRAGNLLVNEIMVREGLAEVFYCRPGWENCSISGNKDMQKRFEEQGRLAKAGKRGIYSDVCSPASEKLVKAPDIKEKPEAGQGFKQEKELKEAPKKPTHPFRSFGGSSSRDNKDKDDQEDNERGNDTSAGVGGEPRPGNDPVPAISAFEVYDPLTESLEYSGTTTLGVDAYISDIQLVDKFRLSDNVSSFLYVNELPSVFKISEAQGKKNIILEAVYASSSLFASSSIWIDTLPPICSFKELKSEYGPGGASIFWEVSDMASGSGPAGLEMQSRFISGSSSSSWKDEPVSLDDPSVFAGKDAPPGSKLHVRMRAFDKAGNSSAWVLATTSIAEPLGGKDSGSSSPSVLISEFATRGPAGAYDEFVELYNTSGSTTDISDWKIQNRSENGNDWTNRVGEGLPEMQIKGHGFVLIAPDTYKREITPDHRHTARWGFSDSGGSLRIKDAYGAVIDQVNYGGNASAGSSQANTGLDKGWSLERKASATSTSESMITGQRFSGNGFDDSGDNDFVNREEPEPQNSQDPGEPRTVMIMPPEPVSDLSAESGSVSTSSLKLSWTAPAGSASGSAVYEMRYEKTTGECRLDHNWASSSLAWRKEASSSPGEPVSAFVSGLESGQTYCFALKISNFFGESDLSNQTQVATRALIGPEERDQSCSGCAGFVPLNRRKEVFAQTFVPEADNISSFSFKLGLRSKIGSRLYELRVCAGEMQTKPQSRVEPSDWECSNPGQELIASIKIPGGQLSDEPEKVKWRRFSLPSPRAVEPGQPHYMMLQGYEAEVCAARVYDDKYPQGEGMASYIISDFLFQTYYSPSWKP